MVKRYELLKFSDHIGVYDTKKHKRLENLCPKGRAKIRVKASAFESGYNTFETYDLHKKLAKKRLINKHEYNILTKKWGCKNG